jgi:hypothetical protein
MGMNSRSIVGAHLEVSRATVPSSNNWGIGNKRNGVETTSCEIRTNWAKDDEAFGEFWRLKENVRIKIFAYSVNSYIFTRNFKQKIDSQKHQELAQFQSSLVECTATQLLSQESSLAPNRRAFECISAFLPRRILIQTILNCPKVYLVKLRKSTSHSARVHSCHVFVRPEHNNFAVMSLVGLHPFE